MRLPVSVGGSVGRSWSLWVFIVMGHLAWECGWKSSYVTLGEGAWIFMGPGHRYHTHSNVLSATKKEDSPLVSLLFTRAIHYLLWWYGRAGLRMYIWRWGVPTKTFTLPFFGRRRYIRPTTTRKREKHKNKLAQSTTSYTVDDGGLRGGRPQMYGWGWLVALMGKQLHRCPRR